MAIAEGWVRITVDLPAELHRALIELGYADGVKVPTRLRALGSLVLEDEALARSSTERARLQAAQRDAQRRQRSM